MFSETLKITKLTVKNIDVYLFCNSLFPQSGYNGKVCFVCPPQERHGVHTPLRLRSTRSSAPVTYLIGNFTLVSVACRQRYEPARLIHVTAIAGAIPRIAQFMCNVVLSDRTIGVR